MKKIVISGSSSLQDNANKWVKHWESNDYEVLDWPQPIEKGKLIEKYPKVHKDFYRNITKTDTLFIMNEDKNNIAGYIGAATFAELAFGVAQNSIYDKNIEIVLLKIPSPDVKCYEEVILWLSLGWIKLLTE